MAGVCDYTAIHTGALQPGPGGGLDQPVPFTLGSNAVLDVHAILTFTVKAGGATAHFRITINEIEVATYSFGTFFGTLNKIVGPNVLRHGTNKLRFEASADDWSFVLVEDVAIWWFKSSL